MSVFTECQLSSGVCLKNRFVKAAMEENLADANQLPSQALFNLYQAWAKGGVGLIITGNVMVDRFAMTGPGGVVLEKDTPLDAFEKWAKQAQLNNTKVIMQINHPGRQVFKRMGGKVLSPSDVALNMGKHSGLFETPKAMTEDEIHDVITRFVDTALQAQRAGFDGVEIHAAHGYLLSQFLSPLTNKRKDEWGGSIQNRSRLLINIVSQVKEACGEQFILSVKLNSADFQRGGFDINDASVVINALAPFNLDFIELSGGSYEAPAMQGKSGDDRTLAREAYFLEFAKKLVSESSTPLMVTGGIKRLAVAQNAVEAGMSLVGLASALAYKPDLINKWLHEPELLGYIPKVDWKDKTLAGLANMSLVKRQLRRLGANKLPMNNASAFFSLIMDQIKVFRLTKRYKQHLNKQTQTN
ncbi:NADH:flavin oxidoreductase/NADH oxidase family protein [Glaciecola sp. KUL10]|uniref:NADH:flavin oxidoreductase/NADH oxidase family protein n=1 Tax=Glaciecola sp. (strain KUL10) TaxID=2161813 RepID=UPI000D783D80|nr:NADH:flavin oxidoreductase/NADH oxidase family protein [Glaciecola sp. KUL10]GBL03143.1 NADH:flavin oxidoreductase [Glaciecola sp. KUL10]